MNANAVPGLQAGWLLQRLHLKVDRSSSSFETLLGGGKVLLVVGLLACAPLSRAADPTVTVTSPNGQVRVELSTSDSGQLQYRVWRANEPVIELSPLGVMVDGVDLGAGVSLGKAKRTEAAEVFPWRGSHNLATNAYFGAVVPVAHEGSTNGFSVELRAFDSGVGLRYLFPGKGARVISGEKTSFVLPAESQVWCQTNTANYEGIYERHSADQVRPGTDLGMPMVVVLSRGRGYAAISEAALFGYSGMTLRPSASVGNAFDARFLDDQQWEITAPTQSPWRVVLVSPDLNGLVNSDVIPALCPPVRPELENAPWIRPGRAVWSWWSQGTGDFERNKLYVDYAQRLGFEYNLVDAGWENWKQGTRGKWDLIRELVEYGRSHGVNIWVWKHFSGVQEREARRQFFTQCHEAGVVGVKIDFMDSESKKMIDFYEQTLRDAAEFQLMINFHGANKPTGEARTWPNEMTREGIRGLEYNKWSALPATHYATLPFTRYLAGHGDFTVCTLRADFLKGTRVGLQLATAVVFTSPVMHWAETPSFYLSSPAVDLIRSMPSVWDETRVLPVSHLGTVAAFARRSGDRWFVGVINAGSGLHFQLDLPFLGARNHEALFASDHPTRPSEFIMSSGRFDGNDHLSVDVPEGGGFVARFSLPR